MSKFISFSLILSSLLLLMNDLQYSNALRNNNNNSNNSNSNTNTNTNELLNSNNHNNEVNDDHEILIVDHNNGDDNARSITSNHSNTFYSLDNSNNNNNNNNSNNNEISHTNSDDNDNNLTIIDVNNDDDDAAVDDFWDTPSTQPIPPSSSASSNSAASTIANNSPSSSSITFASSSSSRSTTPFLPPMPSILTWSSSSPASASTFASPLSSSASTLSTSTLPPPFTNIDRYSPFTNKPFMKNDRNNNKKNNGEQTFQELEAKIWKLMLHGTNMNSEELRMCNRTLIQQHFKSSSRRKVARNMKKDLEKLFNKWNYRFSIIVSATSRNTMGKALHGVWMSISINGIHYFITATHNILDGPKINEEQMEKIEYWAHVHAIAARNMTGYRRYNRIAQKLKFDLDRFYGHGNSWSVIVVKNPLLVKAKIFEDPEYHIEFSRLNGGHFIVFRGGQTIDLESRDNGGDSRNSRINIDEPESDDNTLESETIHDDYRNNIFLMMT